MPHALLALTVLGYLAGSVLLLQGTLGEQPLATPRWAVACGATALLAHAGLLFLPIIAGQPLNTHFFQALSLVAWSMALVMTLVHAHSRARLLLAMIWPIALTAAIAGTLATPHVEANGGWQIRLHVAIALSAYALLSIAALQALAVAWQEHNLRHKRLTPLLRALPPLSAMEDLLFQYIVAGFALLTLTVLSGALFIDDWMAQHLVHKTVLTLLAWLVFGLLVFGRWRFGWRGRTAVKWTLAGMAVLLLAFFGSKFVLEIVLRR
ncbi:MAG: cytochrome c biogenesis protein CcsA [Xanthomonadales bacterium]|nr:Inner membrane protein YpjD [Xanthomonadales bacterium]MCC6593020.1 cytochrome c biogenesis protein CcsA [Xanthomonadales bacterium]MCE7931063.1 inner membrane protein YpjD [Xanthomonadales bacterium PRO6]